MRSACHAALFAHALRRSLSTIIMHSHALQLDVTNLVRGHGLDIWQSVASKAGTRGFRRDCGANGMAPVEGREEGS